MKKNSIGIGLIGCGGYARLNLEALARAEGLHLAAAFDIDPVRVRETCEKFGGVPASSQAALLATAAVEAVIVATPNSQHCADVVASLEAGKHVFVNIPATISTAEARRMIERARACDRVLMAGANHRKNPAVLALQAALTSGAIGVPHLMQASVASPTAYKLAPGSWRAAATGAPLLPFSQMGIIALELALMLWGPPVTVSAVIAKRDGPTETPDHGAMIARYADGRIFSLACSYIAYKSYWIAVSGPKGTATWDRIDGNCVRIDAEPTLVRTPYESKDEQLDELHEFRECIRQQREPEVGAEGIYNLAEFYRTIGESITSGRATPFLPWK